jgi:hypothetical protein
MRRVATSSATLSRHCLMVSLRRPLATAAQSLPCRATARLSATSSSLLHESWTCLPRGPGRAGDVEGLEQACTALTKLVDESDERQAALDQARATPALRNAIAQLKAGAQVVLK